MVTYYSMGEEPSIDEMVDRLRAAALLIKTFGDDAKFQDLPPVAQHAVIHILDVDRFFYAEKT